MPPPRYLSQFTRSTLTQPSLPGSPSPIPAPLPLLGRPHYWRHAFAVLAGYGSALLPAAGWPGCVLSLVGVSGAGKTLAATLSVATHGQPKPQRTRSKTPPAIPPLTVPRSPSAPILYDEITELPPREIARLIYSSTDSQRLTIVTSNRPILDLPHHVITEAHRRRVVELYFPKAMPMADGELLAGRVSRRGEGSKGMTAGRTGGREIGSKGMTGRREPEGPQTSIHPLRSALHAELLALRSVYPTIPDSYRFGLWLAAASLVGGRMAREAGWIDFDPEPVVFQVASQMAADAWRTIPDPERVRWAIRQWREGSEGDRGGSRVDGGLVELSEGLAMSILRPHGLGFSALNSVATPGRSPGMVVIDLEGEG